MNRQEMTKLLRDQMASATRQMQDDLMEQVFYDPPLLSKYPWPSWYIKPFLWFIKKIDTEEDDEAVVYYKTFRDKRYKAQIGQRKNCMDGLRSLAMNSDKVESYGFNEVGVAFTWRDQ
jgi:hypothetical protein